MIRFGLLTSVAVIASAVALTVASETAEDRRELVEVPPEVRIVLGEEMREHLAAVNEVLGYLGGGQLERAAEVAETRMGLSSTGKHRGTGMGPGRFMTPEMRQMGRAMHESATRFAQIATEGDLAASVAAFQTVTAHCVACHNAYRVR